MSKEPKGGVSGCESRARRNDTIKMGIEVNANKTIYQQLTIDAARKRLEQFIQKPVSDSTVRGVFDSVGIKPAENRRAKGRPRARSTRHLANAVRDLMDVIDHFCGTEGASEEAYKVAISRFGYHREMLAKVVGGKSMTDEDANGNGSESAEAS